jgi:Domain of unknown function (DUF4129)
MKRKRLQEEKGPVELVEEAVHLLRASPGSALIGYYVGTLPFVLALLFFWSDMARSAFAHERLITGVFGLSALFVWMKCWHGVFAGQLLAQLCGEPPPRLHLFWLLRVALYQAIVQPIGLFLLPVSLVLLAPLGWVYAFFTNVTVFSGGQVGNVRTLVAKSWRQARLWSMQSHYLVFLFKLFGFFVFLNVMSAVMGVPLLLKALLGLETVFSQSPWAALNTTTLAAAAGITFLCLDPLLKAAYVLRCFYVESLHTGQDLKAELKTFAPPARLSPAASLLFLLFALQAPLSFGADELERTQNPKPGTRNSLASPDLDRSIDEVIQQREYSWRLPRDSAPSKPKEEADENFIQRFFKSIEQGFKAVQRWMRDVLEWLDRLGGRPSGPSLDGLSLAGVMKGLLILLVIALAGLILWLLFRLWRSQAPIQEFAVEALPAVPDVSDENVGAEQLPEDGWIKLARELLNRGELRLALRAFYLAALAHLAERNLITLAKHKSNRDYERELLRRGHALADVPGLFSDSVMAFERVWYGRHGVSQDSLDEFARNVERIKAGA